jgi:hypothetical protein
MKLLIGLIITFAFSMPLVAGEHEHEQHDAHLHGEAELLVAVDGKRLEIEFMSPAMNIVGFEHHPSTEEQQAAVASAIATMKKPEVMLSLSPDAKCTLVSAAIDTPLAGHEAHDKHEKEGHEHEEHAEHEGEPAEETHSDFTAHYRFNCEEPGKLTTMDIGIFKQFPGTESIEAQTISNRGQHKLDLTPEKTTLEL